ncbi:hypothetical protein AB1N83_009094 [Pleurotus pulmonarius]
MVGGSYLPSILLPVLKASQRNIKRLVYIISTTLIYLDSHLQNSGAMHDVVELWKDDGVLTSTRGYHSTLGEVPDIQPRWFDYVPPFIPRERRKWPGGDGGNVQLVLPVCCAHSKYLFLPAPDAFQFPLDMVLFGG